MVDQAPVLALTHMYMPQGPPYVLAGITKCMDDDPSVHSALQIDRPEFIFVHSPLLFSCGARQTKGSRLLQHFIPQNGTGLHNFYDMVCCVEVRAIRQGRESAEAEVRSLLNDPRKVHPG